MSITNPSPAVLVNGFVSADGVDIGINDLTTTFQLEDAAGVNVWTLELIGTDEINGAYITIINNHITYVDSATRIMQNDQIRSLYAPPSPVLVNGSALIFRSTVNNGVDINGNIREDFVTTLGVFIRSNDGYGIPNNDLRVGAVNETTEGDSEYGWTSKINELIRLSSQPIVATTSYPGIIQIGGDLGGTYNSQDVLKVHGMPYIHVTSLPTAASTVAVVNSAGTQVEYTKLTDGYVDVNAAIQGTKINPYFGNQSVTGSDFISYNTYGGNPAYISARTGVPPAATNYAPGSLYQRLDDPGNGLFTTTQDSGGTYTWQRIITLDSFADTFTGDAYGKPANMTVGGLRKKTLSTSVGTVGSGQTGYGLIWNNAASEWQPLGPIGGYIAQTTTLGSTQDGYVLTWVNANSRFETKAFAVSGGAGGDLSGSYPNPTVAKINGNPVASGTPNDGYVLTYSVANTRWEPQGAPPPTGTAGGNLSGSYPNPTVIKINGTSVPATPTADQVLVATSGTAATWQSIVNAQISASAAIAGSKISPNFGTQALTAGTSALGTTSSANSLVGSITFTTKTFSTTGTIDTTTKDMIVYADTTSAGFTLTLPSPTNGRMIVIKDKKQTFGTNNLTIARSGSEKIDGTAGSLVLSINNQEVILTSDGTDWYTQGSAGAVGAAGGDLSGTYPNPVTAKVKGTTITTTGGSLTTGQSLRVTGASSADWGAINLANSNAVSGTLPTANQASQSMVGDVTGTTAASSVVKLRGTALASSVGTVGAGQDSYSLSWNNSSSQWEPQAKSGVTWTADLAGSTNSNQIVVNISGNAVTGGASDGKTTGVVTFFGTIKGSASYGYKLGHDVYQITSDADSTCSKADFPIVEVTSSVSLTATRKVKMYAGVAGLEYQIYNNTTGGQSIEITDVYGNAGVVVPNGHSCIIYFDDTPVNGVPRALTFMPGGDITGTNLSQTVAKINGNPVSSTSLGSTQDGYVLTWVNASSQYQAKPASGGAPTGSAGGDLTGTYPNPTVANSAITNAKVSASAAIAYSKLALTGSIVNADVNASAAIAYSKLALTSNIVNADINASAAIAYSKLALTSSIVNADINTGAAIAYSKLNLATSIVNADINASAAIAYSKLNLGSSIVNADVSSSAAIAVTKLAAGSAGQVLLNNSTPTPTWTTISGDATISSAGAVTVSNLTGSGGIVTTDSGVTTLSFTTTAGFGTPQNITIQQSDNLSVHASGTFTISAQNVPGGTNDGGSLILRSGTKSGAANDGDVFLKTGTTTRLTVNHTGVITIANLGVGVVHADSSGNLTSSTLVNADVDAAAAIAYSKLNLSSSIVNADINASAAIAVTKLAAGTAGQILMNSASPTPTWTSISGDISLGNTGAVTVTAVRGNAFKAETPGAAQDGYVPTWVQANSRFEILPQTGSGGGGGVTTVGTIDSQTKAANGAVIASTSIYMQTADATHVGLVSTGTQTFAGNKTLSGSTTLSALSTGIVHSGSGGALTSSAIIDTDVDAAAAIAGTKISPNFGSQAVVTTGTLGSGAATLGTSTTKNTLTGGLVVTTFTCSSSLTLNDGYYQVFVDTSATRSITLPAPANGREFWITDVIGTANANNITLVRNGSEKINGITASKILQTNWGSWRIVSNGTDWFVS